MLQTCIAVSVEEKENKSKSQVKDAQKAIQDSEAEVAKRVCKQIFLCQICQCSARCRALMVMVSLFC
jgi:hypothetical protein